MLQCFYLSLDAIVKDRVAVFWHWMSQNRSRSDCLFDTGCHKIGHGPTVYLSLDVNINTKVALFILFLFSNVKSNISGTGHTYFVNEILKYKIKWCHGQYLNVLRVYDAEDWNNNANKLSQYNIFYLCKTTYLKTKEQHQMHRGTIADLIHEGFIANTGRYGWGFRLVQIWRRSMDVAIFSVV